MTTNVKNIEVEGLSNLKPGDKVTSVSAFNGVIYVDREIATYPIGTVVMPLNMRDWGFGYVFLKDGWHELTEYFDVTSPDNVENMITKYRFVITEPNVD